MYAATAANDARTIAQLAASLKVTLPEGIAEKAAHLEALEADRRTATPSKVEAIATDLARHLGDIDTLTKATAKAATDLASAEARERISATLVDRCALVLRGAMRANADAITRAFSGAAEPSLEVLRTDAALLPDGFRPDHADTLTPEQYAAWTRAKAAQARLEVIRATLRPLYSTPTDAMLTADAVRALAYIAPPEDLPYEKGHAFARALAGTRHGGSELGPVNIDGVFAPTACAHLGATFAWAGASETAERAAKVNAAGVEPIAGRGSRPHPDGVR